MMLKIFICVFVLHINSHTTDAKAHLAKSSNDDLFPLEELQTGHSIAKRGVTGAVAGTSLSMATSFAKQASMSDVKLITKLIFQRLKLNFKLARANSKGKSWTDFLKALVGAATSAVTGAITEFFAMKMKEKFASYAGGALGSLGSLAKGIGK